MFHLFRSSAVFVFLGLTSAAVIRAPLEKRDQCQSTLNTATKVAHSFVDHYFNSGTGGFNGGSLWTDANAMEDLGNLMLATGSSDFGYMQDISTIGKLALDPNTNWPNVVAGSNDDAGWIVLALWKIADYKGARGGNPQPYLNAAQQLYSYIAGQWDGICGGGG
ncbi:hypothetical protein BDN72DRAFT_961438 [Pluteus cervinus]|uniref:Uncharacterized protein n=1 Tax=Pluteus cervinus TaxID=181527 RepID=A0ACD3AMT5_9AGAR|nr:hypothetical protein BDN72DRAFT_961438 [Pluteus cervinus]